MSPRLLRLGANALPRVSDLKLKPRPRGDVLVAGVLGGVVAAERVRQWPVAVLIEPLLA